MALAIVSCGSTYTSCAEAIRGRNVIAADPPTRSNLPMFYHILFDVFYCTAYFLARVEDIQRVEYLFHLGKKATYRVAEHEREVGRADDAVVVLARDRAVVFCDEFIDFRRELEYFFVIDSASQIHKRDDMEIAVADVSRDGIDELVSGEQCLQFRQKARVIARVHHDVVDKGRRIEAAEVLAQEREALAADGPVFCSRRLRARDLGTHCKAFDRVARLLRLLERFVRRVFRKFRHEDQLGDAGGRDEPHLGDKGEAELYHLNKSEVADYLRN